MLAVSPLKLGMTAQLSFITLHKSQAQPPGHGWGSKIQGLLNLECAFLVSCIWNLFGTSFPPLDDLKQKAFFQMQTEESLDFSEMGTYYELLWDIRVVILSVAGTALDGDQQCVFKADHSLCFDLPYHSFPGSLCINPWGS